MSGPIEILIFSIIYSNLDRYLTARAPERVLIGAYDEEIETALAEDSEALKLLSKLGDHPKLDFDLDYRNGRRHGPYSKRCH